MWEGGADVENVSVKEAQGNHRAALERPVNRGKSETNQPAGCFSYCTSITTRKRIVFRSCS